MMEKRKSRKARADAVFDAQRHESPRTHAQGVGNIKVDLTIAAG